jgi:putative acetyltransferase
MSLVVRHVPALTDNARTLILELEAELTGLYTAEQRHGLTPDQVVSSGVVFFVAHLNGVAAGCGGVAIEGEFGELKRMYVRPQARRRGVARAILGRLEEVARDRGVRRLGLETGDVLHAAIRFYERAGFARCGPFGAYTRMPPAAIERSVFLEKQVGNRG